MVTLACEFCKVEFNCEKWEIKRGRRYCSPKCAIDAGANKSVKYSKQPKHCPDCGVVVGDSRSTRCLDCAGKARQTRPRICASCGKPSNDPLGYRGDLGLCQKCAHKIHGLKKIKRVEIICDQCHKPFHIQPSARNKPECAHNFCSRQCYSNFYSVTYCGINSHLWKGGPVKYYGPNWQQQKRLCRKLANRTCQRCGKMQRERGHALDVHHKIPFRTFNYVQNENDNYLRANDLSNLVAVCRSCHITLEHESRKTHPLS